ncbi:hypothetical protein [Cellulomonas sp. PSBB021]|uniref:hypothetical protein n=1 Tax=Cellulomonas sp. PSBB021 TaxID=2003551 RepID=UPI000B8D8622|nr:hypothetical protein [Cellulomonas sp. PSBB021]ASR55952.1 hypothetical protein CBP52_13550 [Cellulomonas sp. PSBB021]
MTTPDSTTSGDNPRRRGGCLPLVGGLTALIAGFGVISSMSAEGEHRDDGEVIVEDVIKAGGDETYELAGPARALNLTGEGWLEILARDVGWANNQTPMLTATVRYDEFDTETTCETPRTWMWSSRSEPMDLTFECPSILLLDSITSITVTD